MFSGVGFLVVAPAPFRVGLLFFLLAKRKSGREICVSSLYCLFLLFFGFASYCGTKVFHNVYNLFNRFSHRQDRALERNRPQQGKKKVRLRKQSEEISSSSHAIIHFTIGLFCMLLG